MSGYSEEDSSSSISTSNREGLIETQQEALLSLRRPIVLRTTYGIQCSCRTEPRKMPRLKYSHGHVTTLPMAIPDDEISAICLLCEQIMEWSCCSSRNPKPHDDFDTDTLSVNQPSTWCWFSPKYSAIGNAGAFGSLHVSIGARSWTNHHRALHATLSCVTGTGHAVLSSRVIDNPRRLTNTKKCSSIRRNYWIETNDTNSLQGTFCW